jgi:hypothetical protein
VSHLAQPSRERALRLGRTPGGEGSTRGATTSNAPRLMAQETLVVTSLSTWVRAG